MTPQQQQTIIDSEWIVNTALKRQGIISEDLKQDALLYMCKIISRYNASFGVKWETYAYKNVYLYLKRRKSAEIKVKSRYCDEIVIGRVCEPCLEYIGLKMVCDDKENKLIDLKLKGYTNFEAHKIMKLSEKKIMELNRQIKEKAREVLI